MRGDEPLQIATTKFLAEVEERMIGEKLIAAGVITDAQLQQALDAQEGTDKRLGDMLI